MTKSNYSFFRFAATCFVMIAFFSCNNSGNVPFPVKKLGIAQPVTVPLVFSTSKKLNWDTISKTPITPVTNRLDIDALPSVPYDTTGFKPFTKPPEEVPFDLNKLPEADLDLDKIPSQSLELKTTKLPPPTITKAGLPSLQKGKTLSIYDMGQSEGLPANLIISMFKDHNGFLWIGSGEGLFRYDGVHVETFIPGSSSFPAISGITEDNAGNIWFIQSGGGIAEINIHDGTMRYTLKVGGAINNIDKMMRDLNGNIWVYNAIDTAVSIIDPVAGTYKNLDKKTGLSDSRYFQIIQDSHKNIWITTYTGGINIIDPSTGKIKYLNRANGLASDSTSAITKDSSGHIWIGVFEGGVNDGLDMVDETNGRIRHYNNSQGLHKPFSLYLSVDNKGRVWDGTGIGIEVFDVRNGLIRYIDHSDGLSGDIVTSLVPDSYNRMWVSTTTGLCMIDQDAETVHPLGTTQIISQMEDAEGNLWEATRRGVIIINAQRNAVRSFGKANGLSNDFVQSFANAGNKMMVSTDGGFNIIDPLNKTIEIVNKKNGLANDTIYNVFNDAAGNSWLTGPSNGIDLIDSAKKMIIHTDVTGGLSDNDIVDVKQDKNGLIWLATYRKGVDVIDLKAGTIQYLNNAPGLHDTCYRLMLEDEYGRIWIGTDKGIYVADAKNNMLTTITTANGLTHNHILSLLEYDGKIYAGTSNKITAISAPPPGDSAGEWKIAPLDKSEGLIKETNSWVTDYITKDGKYLWGDNGITVINHLQPAEDSSATFITGVEVMGQPQNFTGNSRDSVNRNNKLQWDSVAGPFNLPAGLALPYNANYLQFQFAQINLSRPDSVRYTYVLEGIDKNWSAPTINTFTENYLNLPPGKYAFKVSSKQMNGTWSEPVSFAFTITPPWYKTWWAYTIFVLLCIALLRMYIVYRSRKLQRQNKVLEEKVKHRTEQLQKSLEDLKATQSQLVQSEKMASLGELTAGIAHEIQNPLNFVNNFSEVNSELIAEMKEELNNGNIEEAKSIAANINENEQKIMFHGKRADAIVKGMLQHSRNNSGQKEPTDINALADEYLRLAYHGLRAKDKTFNATMKTDFDESIGKINIVSQDMGRVILNLITNAFYAVTDKKNALAGSAGQPYEPTVLVSTKRSGDKIFISVKDNGNGVPQKVLDKIFQPFFTTKPAGQGTGLGLSLSYDIVKAHGGEIKVETKDGEGSEFIIILPDA